LDAPLKSVFDLDNGIHPCPSILNLCIEKGEYKFQLVLPEINNTYTISYQRCCRNQTISNIVVPDETGMTFTVDITSLSHELCNDSPFYSQIPQTLACVNEAMEIDFAAEDPDGDELRYSFCAPFLGGGLAGTGQVGGQASDPNGVAPDPETAPPYNTVSFILPTFTEEAPLGGEPQISIDPLTGVLSGTPTLLGQYVYGICIEEYRDDVLLSTIKRDFQLNIVQCDTTITPCPTVVSTNAHPDVNHDLRLFPNPTNDLINISLSKSNIFSTKIFDFYFFN